MSMKFATLTSKRSWSCSFAIRPSASKALCAWASENMSGCKATGIPFVVVHDSDRRPSGRLVAAERALDALIADTAGEERVIVLDPDFEAVAGLAGRSRKPERAWRGFAVRAGSEMPGQLVRVAQLAVGLARS